MRHCHAISRYAFVNQIFCTRKNGGDEILEKLNDGDRRGADQKAEKPADLSKQIDPTHRVDLSDVLKLHLADFEIETSVAANWGPVAPIATKSRDGIINFQMIGKTDFFVTSFDFAFRVILAPDSDSGHLENWTEILDCPTSSGASEWAQRSARAKRAVRS